MLLLRNASNKMPLNLNHAVVSDTSNLLNATDLHGRGQVVLDGHDQHATYRSNGVSMG